MVEIQKVGKGGKMVNTTHKPQTQTFDKPAGTGNKTGSTISQVQTFAKPKLPYASPKISAGPGVLAGMLASLKGLLEKCNAPDYVRGSVDGLVASLKQWEIEKEEKQPTTEPELPPPPPAPAS